MKIIGATNADHNNYSKTLTATVDLLIITTDFMVTIRDPCSTAIFVNIPNLFADIQVSMPSFAS